MEEKNKIKSQPVKELEGSGKRISEQEDSEKELTFQKDKYRLGIKNCNELTFEEMFQNYINIIPHFVMVVDEDHTILLANDIVLKVMGKKSEDVRGCYCPKLIHGLDSPFPGCPL
jgi:PAS domain-containing protein